MTPFISSCRVTGCWEAGSMWVFPRRPVLLMMEGVHKWWCGSTWWHLLTRISNRENDRDFGGVLFSDKPIWSDKNGPKNGYKCPRTNTSRKGVRPVATGLLIETFGQSGIEATESTNHKQLLEHPGTMWCTYVHISNACIRKSGNKAPQQMTHLWHFPSLEAPEV